MSAPRRDASKSRSFMAPCRVRISISPPNREVRVAAGAPYPRYLSPSDQGLPGWAADLILAAPSGVMVLASHDWRSSNPEPFLVALPLGAARNVTSKDEPRRRVQAGVDSRSPTILQHGGSQ